jgi:hypothetical protein
MAATDWPCTRQISSSHPPARTAVTAIAAELFLFVLFFDFRWRHELRER